MSESLPALQPNLPSSPPLPKTNFPLAPPPWECKCDAFWLLFSSKGHLPDNAYSPLEASSPTFSDPAKVGEFRGGTGLVMIFRYHHTPVGPYNELVYVPGYFDNPRKGRHPAEKTTRVTRIYVDQKETTYNGLPSFFYVFSHNTLSTRFFFFWPARLAWNFPKHLCRFSFTDLPNSRGVQVEAFSPDPKVTVPFFTAKFQAIRWTPSFPFSSSPLVVQPPVPGSGKEGEEEEIVGTDKWAKTALHLVCRRAKACWVTVQQPSGQSPEEVANASLFARVKPWKVGLYMKDSSFGLAAAEMWEN
jgi:hypothetical protein